MDSISVKNVNVPALGFGTWALSGSAAYQATRMALDLGYRHLDTAQIYGNEAEIGRAIRDSGIKRGDIFLTTKIAPSNLRAEAVRRSHEESLKRLGLDQVDLLLVHWPNAAIPLGETLGALAALRHAGKTRAIGVSNFTVALLREAIERHHADLICNQVEYHPFLSQRASRETMARCGLMLTAYAPVARGRVFRDPTLAAIGKKYDKSAGQVALRWLLDQEKVCAIPKAARREHAAANIDIFDFTLAPEDRAAIDALAEGERLVEWGGYSPDWDAG
ncbi:MAG TPA: aldo/keto reductase [Stellaceae bacterium]|jgi:diketogulonate reductase-like aldo/keto reductase|nr:aldo/keto reductase [Stellaceae bacterium]